MNQENSLGDIVYILTNEAMPDYIKIGRTNDINRRLKDLDWTNIPLPFECYYAARVKDVNFVEQQLFQIFADQRVRSKREFFRANPERVIAAIKMVQLEEVTPKKSIAEAPGVAEELEKIATTYTKRFNFAAAQVPLGAELQFIRDPQLKAVVVDNGNVNFGGEVMSLSRAAQKALNKPYPLQGPVYWLYEGETLDERRSRMEGIE
jgi:hypothetical protein